MIDRQHAANPQESRDHTPSRTTKNAVASAVVQKFRQHESIVYIIYDIAMLGIRGDICLMPGVRDSALLASLAEEVKARRAKLQITQVELAHRCDLQPLFIVRIEGGANQPSLSAFVLLAKGLQAEPEELLACVMKRYRRERRLLNP